jgi:hypothetical protein
MDQQKADFIKKKYKRFSKLQKIGHFKINETSRKLNKNIVYYPLQEGSYHVTFKIIEVWSQEKSI